MDIFKAYKKLKSHVYNDNTLLHVRTKLAKFESSQSFKRKLEDLERVLNSYSLDEVNSYVSSINYIIIPKKLKSSNEQENIYINQKSLTEYVVDDYNVFIDCPIEIHLISILWILEVGHILDKDLVSNTFGYRLEREKDGSFNESNLKLFQKYHEQYMRFRDGALKKAMELHNHNLDTTIINLDVKSFFYNIKFSFKEECSHFNLSSLGIYLNEIMDKIHNQYKKRLLEDKIKENCKNIIPIGLLSSSIVSNYVLNEFDEKIVSDVKPAFYSRYVDDMLFVLTNIKIPEEEQIKNILKNCIFKNIGFNFPKDSGDITFSTSTNEFLFQNEKVKLFHFDKTDSIHLLNKFSKTITKNSSIFKLLPEDKDIFNTLEEASSNIHYSSTVNKISSINGNSLDILNIAKNISQMIRIIINTNYAKEEIFEYNSQLEKIFEGKNILELQRQWEKIFTYLFISFSIDNFVKFLQRVISVIHKLNHENNEIKEKLQENLYLYLNTVLTLVVSLNIKQYEKYFSKSVENIYSEVPFEKIIKKAKQLQKSNLIRHYMVSTLPLINYSKSKELIPLYNNKNFINKFKFNIDEKKIKYSPRFIHYHEISIFYNLKFLYNKMTKKEKKLYLENQEKFIFEKYNSFNNNSQQDDIRYYPKNNTQENSLKNYITIYSDAVEKKDKLNVGLINTEVNVLNSINSFKGKPNLSFNRLLNIFKVLNSAKENKCDMIVFPEIAIPFSWLKILSDFSKSNDIAIVFGMEHFSIKKTVFNFSIAILPFKVKQYTNAFIHFNLKNHYSPEEKETIIGNYYKLPKNYMKNKYIDIYKWKKSVFSIFNCYELTNIKSRSALVGENDFTVAIEYNSDTNYFSNIVGSVSRDNHAYIVQVNSSQYGDSRITKPSKTVDMDIIKIKGGRNTSLIIGEIQIKDLRDFQKLSHRLQRKNGKYKLTPPSFNISRFRK